MQNGLWIRRIHSPSGSKSAFSESRFTVRKSIRRSSLCSPGQRGPGRAYCPCEGVPWGMYLTWGISPLCLHIFSFVLSDQWGLLWSHLVCWIEWDIPLWIKQWHKVRSSTTWIPRKCLLYFFSSADTWEALRASVPYEKWRRLMWQRRFESPTVDILCFGFLVKEAGKSVSINKCQWQSKFLRNLWVK